MTDKILDIFERMKLPISKGHCEVGKNPEDEIVTLLKTLIEKSTVSNLAKESFVTNKNTISLSNAIEQFLTEKLRINPSTQKGQKGWDTEKAITERPPLVKILLELIGNLPLSSIDRSTVETASQNLSMLPPNRKKSIEFRGIDDISEVIRIQSEKLNKYKNKMKSIDKNERLNHPQDNYVKFISESTFNNYIWNWSDFFEWCTKKEYSTRNHAEGLLVGRNKTRGFRKPFTIEQLKIIFESDYYKFAHYDEAYKYWVPMLMLYSGGRLNEFCQLCTADIVTIDNIPCILIWDDVFDGQRLKNEESRRRIPIHSELIKAGFIDFVDLMRRKRSRKLFPVLDNGTEKHNKNAGKWFNRHLTSLKIKTRGLDNHSFRHTVISIWLNNEVNERWAAEISGQGYGGDLENEKKHRTAVTYDIYGHLPNPATLIPYVEMLRFEINHQKFKHPKTVSI